MRVSFAAWSLLVFVRLSAQQPHPSPANQALGTVRFETSCRSAAQPHFNRAVALLHSFAFGQAAEGFNAALGADPECAMAWWGVALSAWGNPFAAGIKPAAQIQRGLAAVTRARSTGTPTPRESRYIEAAARLYERADSIGQGARLASYRDAMAELVAREPADTEAAIFHALALAIAADPADKTYASQLSAGATLERLFVKLPDHPGLAHYIIHSYDVPPLAGRALGAARSYSGIAPTISHALHMPSHTFTRVGHWRQSVDANVASGNAARREGSTAEELHALDYRVYAYMQLGQVGATRQILTALPAIARRMDPNAFAAGAAPPAAGYFAIAAIPARYALERGAWVEAARLELHPSPTPFADAVTWFARGLGASRTGDTTAADSAIAALLALRDRLAQKGESYWVEQVEIQRRSVLAWRSFAAGRKDALAEMRQAADREDATEKNAITPGPIAPARELLGEMLLAARRPAEALAEFESALRHEPNRYRTLNGAAGAAKAAGNQNAARKYSAELLKLRGRARQ